jgi:hypothetical protein
VREPGLILGRAERVEQRGLVSRAERFSQQEVREPVLILSFSSFRIASIPIAFSSCREGVHGKGWTRVRATFRDSDQTSQTSINANAQVELGQDVRSRGSHPLYAAD